MRQTDLAGEKLFSDYAGRTVEVIDGASGEIRRAQVFVAALVASSYTWAQASWTQGLADWVGAHLRCFAHLGGVPRQVVSDNLKAAVTRACRYEPGLNPTFPELAEHYAVADPAGATTQAARQGQGRGRRPGQKGRARHARRLTVRGRPTTDAGVTTELVVGRRP
jgi:transposase